jgi:hypothetical protein
MIRTEEDDEFERIAHEIEMKKGQPYHFTKRKDADDDIQDYVRPWVGLTDEEKNEITWGKTVYEILELAEAKLKEKNS